MLIMYAIFILTSFKIYFCKYRYKSVSFWNIDIFINHWFEVHWMMQQAYVYLEKVYLDYPQYSIWCIYKMIEKSFEISLCSQFREQYSFLIMSWYTTHHSQITYFDGSVFENQLKFYFLIVRMRPVNAF